MPLPDPKLSPQQALRNRKVLFWTLAGFTIVVAAVVFGTSEQPKPVPPPRKIETRNEHCQNMLGAIYLATGHSDLSPMERVNWCLANGYGWDEYKSPPLRGSAKHP